MFPKIKKDLIIYPGKINLLNQNFILIRKAISLPHDEKREKNYIKIRIKTIFRVFLCLL